MRKFLIAGLIAVGAVIPAASAQAQRIPPQPSPDCVLVHTVRAGWSWLCPAPIRSIPRPPTYR